MIVPISAPARPGIPRSLAAVAAVGLRLGRRLSRGGGREGLDVDHRGGLGRRRLSGRVVGAARRGLLDHGRLDRGVRLVLRALRDLVAGDGPRGCEPERDAAADERPGAEGDDGPCMGARSSEARDRRGHAPGRRRRRRSGDLTAKARQDGGDPVKGRGRHGSSGARWSRSFVGSERVGGSRVPRRGVDEWGARETLGGARSKSPAFFGGELKKRADHHATPVKDLEITRGALVASGCSAQPGTRARSEARQSVAMTLEATDPKVRPRPHPRRHPPQHPRVAPHPPKAWVPNRG